MYQSFAILECTTVHSSEHGAEKYVMMLDVSITCGSTKHILLAVPVLITALLFNILPALILIFYPVRIFRRCLTKCKLNGLVLITFVERFHGCYRDGLNGGRDMRSCSSFNCFWDTCLLHWMYSFIPDYQINCTHQVDIPGLAFFYCSLTDCL